MYNFNNCIFSNNIPNNEPVFSYAPGSPERKKLKEALNQLKNSFIEIPIIIGNQEIKTGKTKDIICPHDKNKKLGIYHQAGEKEIYQAIETALKASKEWAKTPFERRFLIFNKAAELLTTKYRYLVNAATMLAISKNAYQAEIDAVCELSDFWRFNSYYMQEIYKSQPLNNPKGTFNYLEYRPLEGYVFASTPFNFTSIAGNLPTAPVIMGNVSLWKPASNAVFVPHLIMKILKEAGLPDGVINFVPSSGKTCGKFFLENENLAGIHFTGSTEVFTDMWKVVGNNISHYKNFPRIVGETGGKDFIFVHTSADIKATIAGIIRGAFEYQGQKCSAASRAYIPTSMWKNLKDELLSEISTIKVGDVEDFSNFMNAVIDEASFDKIKSYIDFAKNSKDAEILCGGGCNKEVGYFIEPTVILTKDPFFKTMVEEIFGPVLTIYIYDDNKFEETLDLCDKTSPYGLTGCIFANDTKAISIALDKLTNSAGNFYVNDKPTGAVVSQQPFGGSRASGTNDKSGSHINLLKWTSARAIKEYFVPPTDYRYPFLEKDK